MSKEIPPIHRPADMPPPHQRTVVRIKDDTIKTREVWAYDQGDVERQQYALELMRRARVSSRRSIGGQPGMRLMHNVGPHARPLRKNEARAFCMFDLEKAFPNLDQVETTIRLYEWLGKKSLLLDDYERQFLEVYMVEDIGAFLKIGDMKIPGVPQGNATSAAMLDVLMRKTDDRIDNWFTTGIYTRWIDDLTFSAPANLNGDFNKSTKRSLRTIIEQTPGAIINDKKTQLLRGDKKVTVTGITFDSHGLMAPSIGIQRAVARCFDDFEAKIDGHEELTMHDVNVFDGYRKALGIAGQPERSSSEGVRSLYNRSIKLGNRIYQIAAQQGTIKPRRMLVNAAAHKPTKRPHSRAGGN